MNGTEERLRSALHQAAGEVDSDEFGSLDRIRTRGAAARRRRTAMRASAGAVGLAAVVVVGLVAAGDGRTTVEIPPGTDPTTTLTSTDTTLPTTPTSAPVASVPESVFPATPQYQDPQAATQAFLEYLGLPAEPYVVDSAQESGTSATVDVRGRNENQDVGRVVSVVSLVSQDGYWYVTGAQSDAIEVDSPAPDDSISSPVTVRGRGHGFEATLPVSVIDRSGAVLGDTFTMGGGGAELEPFEITVDFTMPSDSTGALLVTNTTGLEVGAVDFTVTRLTFSSFDPALNSVQVFFHDGDGNLVPVLRPKEGVGVLRTALTALLEGPTEAEQAQGLSSFFSEQSAGLLLDVTITEGAAVVDFDPELAQSMNGASTSAGSRALLDELNATVFQFVVSSVEYRLGGDCEAFWTWLQVGTCTVVHRP